MLYKTCWNFIDTLMRHDRIGKIGNQSKYYTLPAQKS